MINMRKFFSAAAVLAAVCSCQGGAPLVKGGDKLAFLGDSITQFGADHPGGYARLVVSGLEANGIKVVPVYAGISGHKSNDMLARVDRDVLSKKPAVMTLSCGVNDVWHGKNGVPLEKYKENIAALVDKAQAAGVTPVILTATLIYEDPDNALNRQLAPYNEYLRSLARDRKLPLADLNLQMQEALRQAKAANAQKPNRANNLTSDGVHMAPQGDQVMAEGVLRALGLDDAQIATARAAWLEIPASTKLQVNRFVSLKEYGRLAAAAAKEGLSVNEYVEREMGKALEALLNR